METLESKVAVITGAASGIGEALALALDQQGMHLVLADVEEQKLAHLVDRLSQTPMIFGIDVADANAMTRLAHETFEHYDNVHLLINNAGVMGPMAHVWELEASDWDWVLNVNVKGIANGIRAFVPRMLSQNDASHIVNTASEASFVARAFVSAYHSSKHAVLALTESLAQELDFIGANIRVSVLCPGAVNTAVMDADRNRPADLPASAITNKTGDRLVDVYRKSLNHGVSPEEVADLVIEGIKTNRFYLLPHPEVAELPGKRSADVKSDQYPEFDAGLAKLVRDDTRS